MNDILPHDLVLALNPISDFFGPLVDLLRGYLRILDGWVGSWGIAIILLTVSVRIVIFPLTWKQIKSQRNMQALQPKIKELQRKHKGDKKKLQQETMRLYQEYRINPFASCLPLLLQLPIFICLYYAIRGTPELQGAPFLWFTLGEPDPYYILLAIYVISQLASTELMLTPETQTQQKWIMRAMPFMFVIFLRTFPSGLFVYWITTNLWTVGQQLIIKYLAKKRPVQLEKVDPSKHKRSRFMEALMAAQEQRESQQAGRSGIRPTKKRVSPAGKKARPATKGTPSADRGVRPAAKDSAKAGRLSGRVATSGVERPPGKVGKRPAERPAPGGAADGRSPDGRPVRKKARPVEGVSRPASTGAGGDGVADRRSRTPATPPRRSQESVRTTRTGKRPVKPKASRPRPEGEG